MPLVQEYRRQFPWRDWPGASLCAPSRAASISSIAAAALETSPRSSLPVGSRLRASTGILSSSRPPGRPPRMCTLSSRT